MLMLQQDIYSILKIEPHEKRGRKVERKLCNIAMLIIIILVIDIQ